MRVTRGRMTSAVAVLSVLSSTAWAQEPTVQVMAEVILASNQGNEIEPPSLGSVKDEFASAGIAFSSYKRLSSQTLSLSKQRPVELKLPNGKVASVKLENIKEDTATVKVNAGGTEVGLKLGRQGSVFVRAGAHQSGQLILMLSSGGPKKP